MVVQICFKFSLLSSFSPISSILFVHYFLFSFLIIFFSVLRCFLFLFTFFYFLSSRVSCFINLVLFNFLLLFLFIRLINQHKYGNHLTSSHSFNINPYTYHGLYDQSLHTPGNRGVRIDTIQVQRSNQQASLDTQS